MTHQEFVTYAVVHKSSSVVLLTFWSSSLLDIVVVVQNASHDLRSSLHLFNEAPSDVNTMIDGSTYPG